MQAVEATYGGVGSEQRAFVEWAIALPFVKGNLGDACVTEISSWLKHFVTDCRFWL